MIYNKKDVILIKDLKNGLTTTILKSEIAAIQYYKNDFNNSVRYALKGNHYFDFDLENVTIEGE